MDYTQTVRSGLGQNLTNLPLQVPLSTAPWSWTPLRIAFLVGAIFSYLLTATIDPSADRYQYLDQAAAFGTAMFTCAIRFSKGNKGNKGLHSCAINSAPFDKN